MKVYVEREDCIACGACWAECPEIFEANDDDGLTQITEAYRVGGNLAEGEIPDDLESCAQAGADVCPVEAIRVE